MTESNAAQILSGPEFFRCNRLHSTMRKALCVEYQVGKPGRNPFIGSGLVKKRECCIRCGQGEAILKEFEIDPAGFEVKPYVLKIIKTKGVEIMGIPEGKTHAAKQTKVCKGPCGQEKDLDDFRVNRFCKDGHEGQCRECRTKQGKIAYEARRAKAGIKPRKVKTEVGSQKPDIREQGAVKESPATVKLAEVNARLKEERGTTMLDVRPIPPEARKILMEALADRIEAIVFSVAA
jgi:hypothetical protein